MLENVKLCKYTAPTPVQSYCIPAVLTGHDVVAIAQTGEFHSPLFDLAFTNIDYRLWKDRSIPPPCAV